MLPDNHQLDLFDGALARFLENEPEPGDGELIARILRETPEKLRTAKAAAETVAVYEQVLNGV